MKMIIKITLLVIAILIILKIIQIFLQFIIQVNPMVYPKFETHDIVYLDASPFSYSKLNFIDESGVKKSIANIMIPWTAEVFMFGNELSQVVDLNINKVTNVYWSNTKGTLGFLYGMDYPHVRYPGLLLENGEILICQQDEKLSTNLNYPIQVLDDTRIVINIGRYPDNYLSFYDMENCLEESVYYDGKAERGFAISSNGWLAINEELEGDLVLNVYDEQHQLVFTDNEVDDYYFIDWSKDGSMMIYRVGKSKSEDQLYSYDFKTNEQKIIGDHIYHASFSPDDKKLIIEREGFQLYFLDLRSLEESYVIEGSSPNWKP